MEEAISGAQGKAAGVFPADLARLLCSATKADWEAVRWIHSPQVDEYLADLNALGKTFCWLYTCTDLTKLG